MEKKTYKHLMLDLETMGNKSSSSIISIGALEFDIKTGETGKEFYVNVDLQSCLDLGLNVDGSTIMWWMRQEDKARKALDNGNVVSIKEALLMFSAFCNKDYEIWGNSARFDLGLLQDAYDAARIPICWDFRKERCVRTLVSFNPDVKKKFSSNGVLHNALDDCYFQVQYCSATWKSLAGDQSKKELA